MKDTEKKPAKARLESMLGEVERKAPASTPAKSTCRAWYCAP